MADSAGAACASPVACALTEPSSASLTVVDNLPKEFFTPLDEFDAVAHMLDCLPEQLDPSFLEAQHRQTQLVLETVNSQLSARVMRSYGAFVHGMAQVQQLKSDLVLTAILCRSARKHLSRVQADMVEPGLAIIAKLRRKRALEQLRSLVEGLKHLLNDTAALRTLLSSADDGGDDGDDAHVDLAHGAVLLRRCEARLRELKELKQTQHVAPEIGRSSEKLQALMHWELRRACSHFDAAHFSCAVECALMLDRIDEALSQVHNNFAEAIKESTKDVLHNHVLMSLGQVSAQQERGLEAGKYKDVCAVLRPDYFDSCLAHSFQALLHVLLSHHKMLLWLMDTEAEAAAAAGEAVRASKDAAAEAANAVAAAKAARAACTAGVEEPSLASDATDQKVAAVLQANGRAVDSAEAEKHDAGSSALAASAAQEAAAKAAAKAAEAKAAHGAVQSKASRLKLLRVTLGQSRTTIWDLMQRRVAVFLGSAPLSTFTVDQFLDVVSGVTRFMHLGEAFSGSESHGLRSALRSKAKSFYNQFHRDRLEELRMRLETEMWRSYPLGKGFRIEHIKELRPAGSVGPRLQCSAVFDISSDAPSPATACNGSVPTSTEAEATAAPAPAAWATDIFPKDYAHAAGFLVALSEGRVGARLRNASMDELLDEQSGSTAAAPEAGGAEAENGEQEQLLLCGTALDTARFLGRYLRFLQEMAPMAPEVLRGLLGLLELYFLTVFNVFWTGPPPGSAGFEEHDPGMLPSLQQRLLQMHASTHSGVDADDPEAMGDCRLDLARAAASISLERLRAPLASQPMFALSQTVVAMESLETLAKLLLSRLPMMHAVLREAPAKDREGLMRLEETLGQVPLMSRQIFRGVARGMLDLEPVVSAIRNRSWAPREIAMDHNPYVDQLIGHVGQLVGSLEELGLKRGVRDTIMMEAVLAICEQLVDAYSYAKKCSEEGRALMSLDVKTLQAGLRELLPDLPLHMDFVENYIKAFQLPSERLLEWARAHPEYSVRQLTGLVSVIGVSASTMKRKEQQELLAAMQGGTQRP